MTRAGAPRSRAPRRTVGLALLAAPLALLHLWVAERVLELGADAAAGKSMLRRIEVSFVRELAPAAPPLAPPPAAPGPRARVAAAAPRAASAPEPLPVPPLPQVDLPPAVATDPPAAAPVASLPELGVSAPGSAAPEAAAAGQPFEWPPSTRLAYSLTGYYRGPVEGQASVEWRRDGNRYQVQLEVQVGPSFAPLVARSMTSDGEITGEGLAPRRYEELTRTPLRNPRLAVIALDADRVRLPAGDETPRPEGVQDSASQFVHLTWLFTTRPELLEAGREVALPLALPRRVDLWTYDVVGRETLATPFGAVEAVHVKPRRVARRGGDLTAEAWFAPTLQYLPVRIVIRQDAETYADLMIERLPQQAEPTGR
jgi:hypothetical protein